MTPPFALPPPDFPLPAYVRQVESGLLMPRKAVLPGLTASPGFFGRRSIFPVVAATEIGNDTGATTSYAAPLPSGITAGDLLLVFVGIYNSVGATTVTVPSGWSTLFSSSGNNTLRCFVCAYKVATGSEGATATFTFSNVAYKSSTAYRITDFRGAPEASSVATGGSSTIINPPSLTPSWGAAKTLWIAAASGVRNASTGTISAPSGFSNLLTSVAWNGSDQHPRTSTATREDEVATIDPGPMGSDAYFWAAATVAIRPR